MDDRNYLDGTFPVRWIEFGGWSVVDSSDYYTDCNIYRTSIISYGGIWKPAYTRFQLILWEISSFDYTVSEQQSLQEMPGIFEIVHKKLHRSFQACTSVSGQDVDHLLQTLL